MANAMIKQLKTADDWTLRRQAALRLGRSKGEGVYEALADALKDNDPDVRHGVILSLGKLNDQRAIELLCRPVILEDPSTKIRWAAVTALGQLGCLREIVAALDHPLHDPEWVVRNQALLVMAERIRSMPEASDGEQIKILIRLLTISDKEVHELVVDALARRSTRGLDEMVEAMRVKSRAIRAGVAEALGLSRDPRAVRPLIEATEDRIAKVREEASRGLGRLGDPRAIEPLITMLGDSYAKAAATARDALVAIGKPAVNPLCSALQRNLPKAHRRHIILALGGIRDSASVLPLLNNLSSTYFVVRQATINALSSFGSEVVDALIEMVEISDVPIDSLITEIREQTNKRLRLRAVRSLGEIKNAAAIGPLRELMLEGDREIIQTTQEALSKIGLAAWGRYGAVIALGRIGDVRAVPALIRAMKDHRDLVRAEAARALAKLRDTQAIEPLVAALGTDEDKIVRREAVIALRVFSDGSRGLTTSFRKALVDPSWEVRAEAARALGRVDDEASVTALIETLEDSSYTVRTSTVHALANLGALALPRLLEAASDCDGPRIVPALEALAELLGDDRRADIMSMTGMSQDERRKKLEEFA